MYDKVNLGHVNWEIYFNIHFSLEIMCFFTYILERRESADDE